MNKWHFGLRAIWQTVKSIVPLTIGLVALVLIIAWLSGIFQAKIEPGETDVLVQRLEAQPTDVVHEVTKDYIEEAIGTLKAASRTEVSAKVLATIEEIAVSAGDVVHAGDVLIRLNSEAFDSRWQQTQEALKAAQATRANAESDLSRAEKLLKSRAIARSQFDETETNFKVASAQEAGARQAVTEADILRSYTTITAPKNGRIVDKLAEPGDTARPGQPILVIYDASSLRLEAPVMEELAVHLKVGDKLTVHVDAVDRDVQATVGEIVPQADAPSRAFLVKAILPRTGDLFEGMFGRLLIPAGQRRHLCLATDAIQQIGQLQFVHVVGPDMTIERRLVKTGRLGMPGRVEVLSGVQAGETVVVFPRADVAIPEKEDSFQ